MGWKHVERVWEIPSGMVIRDERLFLAVLASKTSDDRTSYGHDRAALVAAMGMDPADEANHRTWRRMARDLEEAGWISRPGQKRVKGGRWEKNPVIELNFVSGEPWRDFSATARAEKDEAARLAKSIGQQRRRERQTDSNAELAPVVDGAAPEVSSVLEALKVKLVEICGEPAPPHWSLLNRAASWIRDQGGTPVDVEHVASRMAEEWGPKTVTIASIEKHWNRYDAQVGQITSVDVEEHKRQREKAERRQRIVNPPSDKAPPSDNR